MLYRRRRLDRSHSRQVQFDPSRTDPQVVGIERGGDQRIELRSKFQLAPPAFDPARDLIIGAVIVVDGARQKPLCLPLRGLAIQALDFVFGEYGGRSRLRFAVQAKKAGNLVKSRPRTAGGKESGQHDPRRHGEKNTPASRLRIDRLIQFQARARPDRAVFWHRLGARISFPGMHKSSLGGFRYRVKLRSGTFVLPFH